MPKENNFDAMRLFFALSVIVTHSYALTGVPESNDLLYILTNGFLAFSTLGVSGFFIISGYLIFESMRRSHSLSDYYRKRALRIFPGFAAALLMGVIVGAFVSTMPLGEYFTNTEVPKYLIYNITLLKLQHTIKGVFEGNPIAGLINGSTWTIPYEFLYYILLSTLFAFRHNKKVLLFLLLSTFCIVLAIHLRWTERYWAKILVPYTTFNISQLARFGLFFAAGAILSVIDIARFRYKRQLLYVVLLLIVGLIAFKSFQPFSYVLLPPLVILFGLQATKGLCNTKKIIGGDLSYGIYLYGWLIQQTLLYFFKLNALELMITTIPIALACGYLSWHLVEKHPLKLKKRLFQAPVPLVTPQSKTDAVLH